ncbi:ABC transporter substrate-binding protein [Jeotgalibacillus marinus]|uniref:ABC transporter substrate-binding protein n=1 Tax=Jeotgalibacillus marinus TaxID=86667 RepID=A0ABV3Q501_9BACL
MGNKLILLLVLMLSLSAILMGCSSNAADNEDSDPYEIKWYMIGTPQKDLDQVMEEVNEYTKEKINATIDLTMLDWGDYDQRMQVIVASGEPFDISFTSSWANNYVLNARKGAFVELDDMLDEYGKDLKDAIDPAFLEGAKVGGHLYAVPTNKEVGQQSVLVFNERLADKYNMDLSVVNSLEDVEPFLKTIKENEPNFNPIATFFPPDMPFDYIIDDKHPFAIPLDSNDHKIINPYETQEMLDKLKTMHDYYEKGYIRADAATSTDPNPLEVENWFMRKEFYQPYAELQWSRSAGYDVVVRPESDPVTLNGSVTGSMQAISITSKNPEKSLEFLNLLNTDPKLRTLLDMGIKDVHYEEMEDGKIKDLPARIESFNMPSFAIGNQFILPLYEDEPEDKWDAFKEFNEKSTPAPTLGFHFDPSPVRTELAAISNVTNEFAKPLLTGSVDPEEYLPKANQKFEEAGLEKVLNEMQKQYDEWREDQQS